MQKISIALTRNVDATYVYLMLTEIKLKNTSCYVRKFTDFGLHHTFRSQNQYFAKGTVEIISYNLSRRMERSINCYFLLFLFLTNFVKLVEIFFSFSLFLTNNNIFNM